MSKPVIKKKKKILTSNLLLEHIDLTLQAPDLHLPVGAERALACLVLQGLHGLRRLWQMVQKHVVRTALS